MKRLVAIEVCLVLIFSVAISAFADGNNYIAYQDIQSNSFYHHSI